MLKIAALYEPIAEDLREADRVLRDELVSDQAFISDLCQHVGQFHGKRVRPALLLLAGRACGAVTREHHVLAAVVELVHIATLVHDDVLDEADVRRRAATVNRLWGNERAVLMGDFLISHAFHLCSSLDSQFASRAIGQATNITCEGEMMQVLHRGNLELGESEYLDIISRKTAELIAVSCMLGARVAGADEGVVRRLYTFGRCLGVAFQIADDLLDLTGDEAEVGKSLGRDVHKGKLTLPLIHYLRTQSPARRGQLMGLLRGDDPQRYRQIAGLLQDSDSLDYAYQAAFTQIAQAREAISALPACGAKQSLDVMAEYVVTRRE
jgi:octaprenyl-diphosphate synthase